MCVSVLAVWNEVLAQCVYVGGFHCVGISSVELGTGTVCVCVCVCVCVKRQSTSVQSVDGSLVD